MELRLCGGLNEIVGIGFALAIIRMSSTPFWLANTGGSWEMAARARCAPQARAAAAQAVAIDRCSERLQPGSLCDMRPSLFARTREACRFQQASWRSAD